MRTYRRLQSLSTGVNSPANKGILVRVTIAQTTLTLICLDPNGNEVTVTMTIGVGNAIIPIYVKRWASSGGTVAVYALN